MPERPRGVKTITALQRGLEVLRAVERMPASTLAELHRETLIPKATLLRILKTLQQNGWVRRGDTGHRYLRSPANEIAATSWHEQLAALAQAPRIALQRKLSWPTDLAVRDGSAMLVLETHRPLMGLTVNYRGIGMRPHMLASALGRCYLAFCGDAERKDLLATLVRSPAPLDLASRDVERMRRLLSQVRACGYAARDPHHVGADSDMAQRFGAIAVPVHHEGRVVASFGCAWLVSVANERDIVREHLSTLQTTARAISSRLERAALLVPPVAPVR